jgi:2-dehydro-3-deoxygalactonokinase
MDAASFIAGDWGTSHLRLFLCDQTGAPLDERAGPGAAAVGGRDAGHRFADTFDSLIGPWTETHGRLPSVLCGMVGSSIGWTQAPYVACPAVAAQIAGACASLRSGDIHIVPGLSCRNPFNAPDFMRGEETQILGAVALMQALHEDTWQLCLPGTHTKWVVLKDGVIQDFFTAPGGELFALLCEHSVLVRKPDSAPTGIDAKVFKEGVARCNEFPHAQLLHRLFECRSRQLSGELAAESADAFLSGLMVGSDVLGALRVMPSAGAAHPVCLIGTSRLTELYSIALASHGCRATQVDGAQASLAGLARVRRQLSERK